MNGYTETSQLLGVEINGLMPFDKQEGKLWIKYSATKDVITKKRSDYLHYFRNTY